MIGNHDLWALQGAEKGLSQEVWLGQGGLNTVQSYDEVRMLPAHALFLRTAHAWIKLENTVCVHGGFDPARPLAEQNLRTFVWDRSLLFSAEKRHRIEPDFHYGGYDDIFIGHTTTEHFGSIQPLHFCNIWALDTGAGWGGALTIMDIDTKEYWQSELSALLYETSPRF